MEEGKGLDSGQGQNTCTCKTYQVHATTMQGIG